MTNRLNLDARPLAHLHRIGCILGGLQRREQRYSRPKEHRQSGRNGCLIEPRLYDIRLLASQNGNEFPCGSQPRPYLAWVQSKHRVTRRKDLVSEVVWWPEIADGVRKLGRITVYYETGELSFTPAPPETWSDMENV